MPQRGEQGANGSSAPPVAMLGRSVPASQFALRFFGLSSGLLLTAGLITYTLTRLVAAPRAPGHFIIPTAFVFSTTFLILCSLAQERGLNAVRHEHQRQFRRALVWALVFGTAFVGVQAFGLWCIVQNLRPDQNAGEAQLGATALVMGAAAVHVLHVTVALLFLTYVTLRGMSDRYDHEYSFGVAFCAWFWHALGILWIFILGAYGVVYSFLSMRVSQG